MNRPSFSTVAILALLSFALLGLRMFEFTLSGAGLHVDEAQYWLWSRDLQWGYFSKPPVLVALITASTAMFGNSLLGVKALAMTCWILSAWVLGWLAYRIFSPYFLPLSSSMPALPCSSKNGPRQAAVACSGCSGSRICSPA